VELSIQWGRKNLAMDRVVVVVVFDERWRVMVVD
jgi:hypothetical protein